MSSDGDDDPHSPSQFLEAPSSQSLVVDAKPFVSQTDLERDNAVESDQDSYDEDRENRFPGPASTWRDYTADERALVASIDQERASDLSVHLYNAHALKSRLFDREIAEEVNPWQRKQHWIKAEQDGATPWHPDPNWTSWPLQADDVPRKSEGFGKDALIDDALDGTLRMPVSWRAGADLEDEVQALMLRKAKERFLARDWVKAEPSSQPHLRSRSASQLPSSPPSAVRSRQSSVASEGLFLSSVGHNDLTTAESISKPELMIDDEETSRMLKPSARHVLSKLDDVLMGLHTSRQYRLTGPATTTIEPAPRSQLQKRKRRSTTGEAPRRSVKAQPAHSEQNVDREKPLIRDYAEHASGPHALGPHALGPRDWSEVLGVASLTGWSPAVIERATKRCATLFGEHMSFRTMPETAAGNVADKLTTYVPAMVPDLEMSGDEDVEMEHDSEPPVETGFYCPEPSCPQHHRIYEKRFMIRQHLRRVHKYNQDALDGYDQARAPLDVKASVEELEVQESIDANEDDEEQDETQPVYPAVKSDGFMMPVEIFMGRGTDVQDRKRRPKRVMNNQRRVNEDSE